MPGSHRRRPVERIRPTPQVFGVTALDSAQGHPLLLATVQTVQSPFFDLGFTSHVLLVQLGAATDNDKLSDQLDVLDVG
jgi:hypothetical protein